jgi:hypothetical protein
VTGAGHFRLGLIDRPVGSGWHVSHCQNPFAQKLAGSRYRVHFAGRDTQNRSRGGWVELEIRGGSFAVSRRASGPSLELGRLGAFDDAGAMPGSLVEFDGRLLLYYTGWTLARSVPFLFFIGLAESHDGGESFNRVSEAPVLGRNLHDPFLAGAPWVLNEGGRLRMWYVSASEWRAPREPNGKPIHYYSIKHATSWDGVHWETNDRLCLPLLENEHAVARPVVTFEEGRYRMLYSARRLDETYRIYSASSSDGLSWNRESDPIVSPEGDGWESEMVCYACGLSASEGRFIFYNGNSYGRDGFGAIRVGGGKSK